MTVTKKRVTTTKPRAPRKPKPEPVHQTLIEARNKAKKFETAAKEKALRSLNYIEMLANTSGTDITGWDVLAVLGENKYDATEQEINRNFFVLKSNPPEIESENEEETTVTTAPILTDEIIKELDKVANSWSKDHLETLKQEQEDAVLRAESANRQAEHMLIKATELQQKIDAFNPKSTGLGKQVADLIRFDGFWQFEKMQGRYLYLATSNGISCVAKDGKQVPLGKFLVEVDTTNLGLRVLPYADNKVASGYYHPHVATGGSICWGNGHDTARRLMQAGKLAELMQLMGSLLVSYNDAAPYKQLGSFINAKKIGKERIEQLQVNRNGDY